MKNDLVFNKFYIDDYIKYRLFTYNKFVNISKASSIVPFVDIIDTDPLYFNLEVNYNNENQTINVKAVQEINKGDKLVLAVVEMTNMGSFIIYGKTYESNKDFLESFKMAKISALFLKEKNYSPMLANTQLIDLMKPKFYEDAIPDYIELSKIVKGDGSSVSALKLFIESVETLRKQYNQVTRSALMDNFFDLKVVENIKSILETETNFLDKKIRELKKLLSYVDKDKLNDL